MRRWSWLCLFVVCVGCGSPPSAGGDAGGGTDAARPPGAPRRVFATSSTFAATAFDKDTTCQSLADAAGLGGTWVAWLSYGTTNAIDRIGAGPWYLVDGTTRVATRDELTHPPLEHAIDMDEMGHTLDTSKGAWTGTSADGTASGDDCVQWTSWNTSSTDLGTFGSAVAVDGTWTTESSEPCGGSGFLRLYCFEN